MSKSLTAATDDQDGGARRVREQALFAAFLESAPAAVAMLDRDMRYLYASRRWYTDYGLEGQRIIGRSHYEVFPEIGEEWKAVHRRALEGRTETREIDGFARADGSFQFLRWEVRPWRLTDGSVGGIIMLTEEITDQQRRIIEIAEEQVRFRAALTIADAAVWEFDANTGRFYASEKLAELTGQPNVDESWVRNFSSFLHPDDLEGFQAALNETTFHLPELAQKVVALYSELAAAKGNRMTLSIEPSASTCLRGDVIRIRQILSNLISNANKFTDGGRIDVSVERAEGDTPQTVFCVSDTGIGIAADQLEQVFDPFVQVDPSVSRRFEGTGLGLAICKRLAEHMRGSITVTSKVGEGSTFRVALPLAAAEPPFLTFATTQQARPAQLRILVAEDNAKNQQVIQTMLVAAGLEIVFAEDGAQAVERWNEGDIDLVLMDVRMPVVDGLWATRRIRNLERELGLPHTPIIALTADSTDDGVAKALDAGMDAYLAKPVRPRPLLNAIAELVRPPAD